MRRVQYVSQTPVKEADVYQLTDREQDDLIREVAQHMQNDMRDRVGSAMPLGPIGFEVRGPFRDPIQGLVHVHTITAWFDLDTLPRGCQFHVDATDTMRSPGTGDVPVHYQTEQIQSGEE